MILKKKETNLKELLQNQERSTYFASKPRIGKTKLAILKPDVEKIDNYKEFFTKFPGLKFYMNSNTKELKKNRERKKRENMDKDRFKKYKIIDD